MPQFLLYRNDEGTIYWYLVGDSGRKLAESGEAYESVEAAEDAIAQVQMSAPHAQITDRTDAEPMRRAEAHVKTGR